MRLAIFGLLTAQPAMAGDLAGSGVPGDAASRVFAEAQAICARDHGRLWGRSLCGPMLLVDPASRAIVANAADRQGALVRDGANFTGVMPRSESLANSDMRWSGMLWTEILWPLPARDAARHVLIAHELFHRIQPDLGVRLREGDNAHLDTLGGRYWLQLEWRALARALQARRSQPRVQAIRDALAFRAERYRLFPQAAENERALELNEGVAEYTGVRLGLIGAKARTDYAVGDLASHVGDPTFVRSFAYATGPAYGLLLDRYAPGWRGRLGAASGLDALLRAALPRSPTTAPSLDVRAATYDAGALRAAEETLDRHRQAGLAVLRARLIDGPVLHIPGRGLNFEFDPRTLQPLGDAGTVYPHIRATGDFGVLEANNGALLNKSFSDLAVSVADADPRGLKGDGWTLTLRPGWAVKPAGRAGDWAVTPP